MYKSSTFLRAQGVLRKNFKLEDTLGSEVKQFIGMILPISRQP